MSETTKKTSDATTDEKSNLKVFVNESYTFRKLNAEDTFLMMRIIGKTGVNEFKACFEKGALNELVSKLSEDSEGKELASAVGINVVLDVVNVLMCNIPRAESEIYSMLSNTSNLSVEQVKALEPAHLFQMVIDFVKKEEFKDFIKVASGLLT